MTNNHEYELMDDIQMFGPDGQLFWTTLAAQIYRRTFIARLNAKRQPCVYQTKLPDVIWVPDEKTGLVSPTSSDGIAVGFLVTPAVFVVFQP